MRRVRIAVCLIFIVSCVIFGVYFVKVRMVEDRKPPVITCEEDTISVSVSAEEADLLAGVKAKDNRDGDISDSVRISSMSHFISKGKRTITYVVFDKANHAATLDRTVLYTDYYSPKLYLKSPLRYEVKDLDDVEYTKSMTVEDCLDGDLTNQIYTTWTDGAPYSKGVYSMTAQVSNSAGDVRAIPLEVVVVDSTDEAEQSKKYPMLSEYIVYTKVGSSIDANAYLTGFMQMGNGYKFGETAEEMGVYKDQVGIQSKVDYAVPGVYPIEYTYTDANGITAVTKLFVVVEE